VHVPLPNVCLLSSSLIPILKALPTAQCIWANPFEISNACAQDRVWAIERYEKWLLSQEKADLVIKAKNELKGKRLACWCFPKACHGDVLARYVWQRKKFKRMLMSGRVANESMYETNIRRKELGLLPGLNVHAKEFVPAAVEATKGT